MKDTGTVKWFSPVKGYGFVASDNDKGKEYFLHKNSVEKSGLRSVKTGDKISFEKTEFKGRISAENIVMIEESQEDDSHHRGRRNSGQ